MVRVPRCFLTESDFPVDHCGNLAVASEVEADPASFDVAAQRGGQSARFGNFAASIRDQGFPVDLGHEVAIEFSAWVTGKALVEELPDFLRTVPEPAASSACPKHELKQTLGVQMIQLGLRVGFGKKFSGLDDRRAVWLLQGDPERNAFPRLVDKGVEIANPEGGRNKVRIQGRDDGWFSEVHKRGVDQGKPSLPSVTLWMLLWMTRLTPFSNSQFISMHQVGASSGISSSSQSFLIA